MNSALYIGATGMKGLSEGMQVTTHNIANSNTIGYKQQDMLFSDLIYTAQGNMGEWWQSQAGSRVALGQTGKGLQIEAVRTIYQQGAMESSNTLTDMAINGKGFFQVKDQNGELFYTRAGDFRPDKDGIWRMPAGLALQGYRLNADGTRGGLEDVQIDKFGTMPGKPSSTVEMTFHLDPKVDRASNEQNPFFSLLGLYDGRSDNPLPSGTHAYSQPMTLFDQTGAPHQVTVYFDGAPASANGPQMEFLVAGPRPEVTGPDGIALPRESGDGLLMSGVLQFDHAGKLIGISAFRPKEGTGKPVPPAGGGETNPVPPPAPPAPAPNTPDPQDLKDLRNWEVAPLNAGLPRLKMNGTEISMDFGIRAVEGGWSNVPESAAAVGTDPTRLPTLGTKVDVSEKSTRAQANSSPGGFYSQDGYAPGALSSLDIKQDGTVVGRYSNNQSLNLWQIPVARFVSEDGLRREGNNLFAATDAAGQMELGMAGTENYGHINAYNIEMSNVDMASEMVDMIITQRGFQSNSKVVTTADQMLQKAMELKRS